MARERVGHSLQATALVNEFYVRMIDLRGVSWRDRAHFFSIASRLSPRGVCDAARARGAIKRGAESPHVILDEDAVVSSEPSADLVALDDALTALAAIDARKGQIGRAHV